MKKIAIYTFCIAFLAAGMTSCAKTTKGKVTNEWRVVSYEENRWGTDQAGNVGHMKTSMTETSFTDDITNTNSSGNVVSESQRKGSVNSHELTIKKDGTWFWVRDITYVLDSGTTNRTMTEESGTWSFVGKTKGDDFKKNERVLFNVLNRKVSVTVVEDNAVVSDDSNNTTFLAGENMQIYTIKASKKKELELELESNVVSEPSSGGGSKDEGTLNITLEEK